MATKITIKIGPFSAPGRVLTAVREDDSADLKTVCDGQRKVPEGTVNLWKTHAATQVNSLYRCPKCLLEHRSYHPFPRGSQNPDGSFTVIDKDSLEEALAVDDDVRETLTFLAYDRSVIEALTVPSGKFYYVGPTTQPAAYALLRDVMRKTPQFAWLAQWAYRTSPMRVRATFVGELIAIQQLAEPATVVAPPQVILPEYDPNFLEMALSNIDSLKVDFNPHSFVDTRKAKLAELVSNTADLVALPDAVSTQVDTASAELSAALNAWVVAGAAIKAAKKPARVRKPVSKIATTTPLRKRAARTTRKSPAKKEVA